MIFPSRTLSNGSDRVSPATPPHVPLARVTRGDATDSIHYGSVAVVGRDGRVLFAAGDPSFITMTRSALKPLQAVPLVAAGGVERFGFSREQMALLCASHSGEPRHVSAVADMLRRVGGRAEQLQCGVHPPLFYAARDELPPAGVAFTPLQHNCSGKHTGMLAYCLHCGLPTETYLAFDHPLQRAIRQAVAHLTGTEESRLIAGIDGCSAPNYAVPLSALAFAYARLAGVEDERFGRAPLALGEAMSAHPEMVSGEKRNDLALMRAAGGDWVTKVGAEGVQAIGVRSKGWGIAVKVADGNARGLHPATVAVLEQLGLLDDARRTALAAWREPTIRNYRGIVTGKVEPVVALEQRG
jgi:L-asparaginase II